MSGKYWFSVPRLHALVQQPGRQNHEASTSSLYKARCISQARHLACAFLRVAPERRRPPRDSACLVSIPTQGPWACAPIWAWSAKHSVWDTSNSANMWTLDMGEPEAPCRSHIQLTTWNQEPSARHCGQIFEVGFLVIAQLLKFKKLHPYRFDEIKRALCEHKTRNPNFKLDTKSSRSASATNCWSLPTTVA